MNAQSLCRAEKSYIGCLVCFRQTDAMLAAVDPADLTPEPRRLYEAVREMHGQGREIDPVLVLGQAGEDLRGYLAEAVARPEFEHADAWQEYARVITENAALRRAQAIGLHLASCDDIDEARQAAAGLSQALADCGGDDEWEMAACLRETLAGLHQKPDIIETGFGTLDKHLLVSPGDFIVVGGRPSSGKTAFTLQMAAHMARTRRVAYFSLETGRDKLTKRLLASVGGVELARLSRHDLGRDDEVIWRKLACAARQLQEGRLAIVRAAVLAHGGSCTAENIPGGVRFQVRLPALQSER